MELRGWRRSLLGSFISWLFFFLRFSCSDKGFTFVKEATTAPPVIFCDYIIIGGGTAGCPLAATLSQGSAIVLVLERGGSPYTNPNVTDISKFASVLLDKSPNSPAQPFTSKDGVFNARARILGGGSAVNAGFYSRASTQYINQVGWDENMVEQAYEWVEGVVAFQPTLKQWETAFHDQVVYYSCIHRVPFYRSHFLIAEPILTDPLFWVWPHHPLHSGPPISYDEDSSVVLGRSLSPFLTRSPTFLVDPLCH